MHLTHPFIANAILLFLGFSFIGFLAAFAFPLYAPVLFRPRQRTTGDWVAEVYLNWEICRGSTMYRQRFRTKEGAARFARFHAWILDRLLPRYYFTEGWSEGSRVRNTYDFAICWGVRRLVGHETTRFSTVWATTMPGASDFHGEHRDGHPRNDEDSGLSLGLPHDYQV